MEEKITLKDLLLEIKALEIYKKMYNELLPHENRYINDDVRNNEANYSKNFKDLLKTLNIDCEKFKVNGVYMLPVCDKEYIISAHLASNSPVAKHLRGTLKREITFKEIEAEILRFAGITDGGEVIFEEEVEKHHLGMTLYLSNYFALRNIYKYKDELNKCILDNMENILKKNGFLRGIDIDFLTARYRDIMLDVSDIWNKTVSEYADILANKAYNKQVGEMYNNQEFKEEIRMSEMYNEAFSNVVEDIKLENAREKELNKNNGKSQYVKMLDLDYDEFFKYFDKK